MTGILRESQIGWSQHRNCAPDGNDGHISLSKMTAGCAGRTFDEALLRYRLRAVNCAPMRQPFCGQPVPDIGQCLGFQAFELFQ